MRQQHAGGRRDRRAGHHRQDPGDASGRADRSVHDPSPIGAHIQIKGGLAKGGLAYTDAVAARAVQVFVGNPRGWKLTAGDPQQDALFTAGCTERGIPSFIHTPYLVNVGSPTEATVEQSIASIAHNLARGAQLGCAGRGRARRARPSARTATTRRCASCTSGCCRCSTALPDDGPGC